MRDHLTCIGDGTTAIAIAVFTARRREKRIRTLIKFHGVSSSVLVSDLTLCEKLRLSLCDSHEDRHN